MQTEEIVNENELDINALELNDEEWKEIEEVEETEINGIVSSILEITEQLDNLDEYFEKLSSLQSKVDEELSDLLHFIENPKNKLNNKQSYKLIEYIREKRIERRSLFNDFEVKRVFNDNRNKLCYTNQRQFFLNAIHKKNKELNNTYKPRRLSDEDIWARIK